MMEREGVVYGMTDDEYHGQGEFAEFATAEFSSSAAKKILESPAHYKHTYIDGNRRESKAFDIGHAVHAKVLGTGRASVVWPDELLTPSGRRSTGKDAQSWEEAQKTRGLIVVSEAEQKAIDTMAENVLAHPLAGALFEQAGHPEVSLFANSPEGVRLRGRFDYLPDDRRAAVDLKTARDASPRGFANATAEHGYDVQWAHYNDTAEYAGDPVGGMVFVVVENTAPYLVAVYQPDGEFVSMGVTKARHARQLLQRCIESGKWPGYPEELQILQPPVWSVYDYQDKYESGEIRT